MQAQPPHSRTRWPLVFLLVATGMVAAVQVGKVPAVLPALRADWGGTLFAAAWLASVFAVVGAVGGSLIGQAVARLGMVRSVTGGMAVLAVAGLLGAAAPSWPLLLLARGVEGIGLLLVTVAVPVLLRTVSAQRDQPAVFASWGTYMPVGVALALLAQPLVAAAGWRALLAVCAVLAGVSAAVAAYALAATPVPRTPEPAPAAVASPATERATASSLRLATLFGCYTLAWFGVLALLPLASRAEGAPLSAAVLAGISFANALGNLSSQWFRRMGVPGEVLAACGFTGMGCCVLALFLGPDWLVAWASVCFSAVGGVVPPVVFASATALATAPGGSPRAVGRVVQGSSIGQLLGPPLVGLGADLAGWPGAAIPICAACLLAITLCATAGRHAPPLQDAHEAPSPARSNRFVRAGGRGPR